MSDDELIAMLTRQLDTNTGLLRDAQNLIDRLRAEVAELQQARDNFHMAYRTKCDAEGKALREQVERLEKALRGYHEVGKGIFGVPCIKAAADAAEEALAQAQGET